MYCCECCDGQCRALQVTQPQSTLEMLKFAIGPLFPVFDMCSFFVLMPAMMIFESNFRDLMKDCLELYSNFSFSLFLIEKSTHAQKEKKFMGLFPFTFGWLKKRCGWNKVHHNWCLRKITDHVPILPKLSFRKNNLGSGVKDRPDRTNHKCVILSPFLFHLSAICKGKVSKLSNSDEGSAALLVQTGVDHCSWWSSTDLHRQQAPVKISCSGLMGIGEHCFCALMQNYL